MFSQLVDFEGGCKNLPSLRFLKRQFRQISKKFYFFASPVDRTKSFQSIGRGLPALFALVPIFPIMWKLIICPRASIANLPPFCINPVLHLSLRQLIELTPGPNCFDRVPFPLSTHLPKFGSQLICNVFPGLLDGKSWRLSLVGSEAISALHHQQCRAFQWNVP